jgi:hypothetical protein
MHESLLTPSLSSRNAPAATLYSVRSSFLLAFFGGPLAIILYSALNSVRLRRPLDALAYLAALALVAGLYIALLERAAPLLALGRLIGRNAFSVISTCMALLLMGAFYLMHRKQHRANQLFGADAPSPWIPAILCAAIAYGADYLLGQVIQ